MTGRLVVIGAGGFGREVIDVVRAINAAGSLSWDLVGVVDDPALGLGEVDHRQFVVFIVSHVFQSIRPGRGMPGKYPDMQKAPPLSDGTFG